MRSYTPLLTFIHKIGRDNSTQNVIFSCADLSHQEERSPQKLSIHMFIERGIFENRFK